MRLRIVPLIASLAILQATPAFAGKFGSFAGIPFWDWVLFILIVPVIAVLLFSKNERPPAPPPKAPDTYGTAAWAPLEIQPRHVDATAAGVFLGQSAEAPPPGQPIARVGAPICTPPATSHHTLIVASTRSGKGTRIVIPTLLRYEGSVFVVDPKGENAAVTANARRDMGHTVHIINPWGQLATHFTRLGFTFATYNPLDALDPYDDDIVSVAESLADAMCVSDGKDNPFFRDQASSLLSAILLYLTNEPTETKTLARLREIVGTLESDAFRPILAKMIASSAFDNAIRNRAAQFEKPAKETYSGVALNLNRYTRFIDDKRLKAATRESSFRMTEVATSATDVYLIIPFDKLESRGTWLRLLITALGQTYKEYQTRYSGVQGAPEKPNTCLTLIDELPALGRLASLRADIATIAGFGVHYVLIIQNFGQLKSVYGDDANTIVSNCSCQWYCNITDDLETARTLSERLGDKTIVTSSTSTSTGSTQTGETESSSTTKGEAARRLLQVSEITRLGRDVAIAFLPGEGHPLYLRPIDYWKLETVFAGYRHYYPKLFWDPPLAPDSNPYAPRFRLKA